MKVPSRLLTLFLILPVLLSSCEFRCSIGDKSKTTPAEGVAKLQDGAAVYNGITLEMDKVKVSKAYLIFEDGSRVPDNNFVDFNKAVRLVLLIESGWLAKDGKVFIDASEHVVEEDGTVVLDEPSLFKDYKETGIDENDAKTIALSVWIKPKEGAQPTHYNVSFMVSDSLGKGYIKGKYRLYSK